MERSGICTAGSVGMGDGDKMEDGMTRAVKEKEVYAIIPARAGSKGIKDKNIRCLNGYPMIAYSIAAARSCPSIARVLVSTDSEQYAEIARYYGAEVPFLRPKQYATDRSTDIEFVEHAIRWLSDHEGVVPGYLVHLRPTYPIRDVSLITRAIRCIQEDPEATSLRSAHHTELTPYKWFTKDKDGFLNCLFEQMSPDEANSPRQDFPAVYIPDGYVDILKVPFIIKSGLLHGDKVRAYEVPPGIDVDTVQEMEAVERYMAENEHELYRYLRERYKVLDRGKDDEDPFD